MEIWKNIEGYEGLYQVSTHGRVRSLNYNHTGETRILSQGDNKGYKRVCLVKEGVEKNFFVHRLVAEAFIPNWFDDPEVNHRDENPSNNNVENLEWCSSHYNCNYGNRNKKIIDKLINGKKSVSVLQYTINGDLVCEYPSAMEAERNGFNNSHIIQCCKGKLKQHKGYIWKYK